MTTIKLANLKKNLIDSVVVLNCLIETSRLVLEIKKYLELKKLSKFCITILLFVTALMFNIMFKFL